MDVWKYEIISRSLSLVPFAHSWDTVQYPGQHSKYISYFCTSMYYCLLYCISLVCNASAVNLRTERRDKLRLRKVQGLELKSAIEYPQSEECCQLYLNDLRRARAIGRVKPWFWTERQVGKWINELNVRYTYSHLVYCSITGRKCFNSRSNGVCPKQRFVFCNLLQIKY